MATRVRLSNRTAHTTGQKMYIYIHVYMYTVVSRRVRVISYYLLALASKA